MKIWKIVLAIYLIISGLIWLVPGAMAGFPAQGIIMGVLAIAAAVLLLMDK
jgi:hypothetical protein